MRQLALAAFPLAFQVPVEEGTRSLLQYWVQFIRESLGHVDEELKLAAVAAYEAVAESYLATSEEGRRLFSSELLLPLQRLLEARGTPCHKRIGAARALGSTPAEVTDSTTDEVRGVVALDGLISEFLPSFVMASRQGEDGFSPPPAFSLFSFPALLHFSHAPCPTTLPLAAVD